MDALLAPPTSHGPILLVAGVALACVVAALNLAFDRLWGRHAALALCALTAGAIGALIVCAAGFGPWQSLAWSIIGTPTLCAVIIAKRALRRALHVPS